MHVLYALLLPGCPGLVQTASFNMMLQNIMCSRWTLATHAIEVPCA